MEQRTAVVTGGSSGLGFECARQLASSGRWHVVLACRDLGRAEEAARRIRERTSGAALTSLELDLSSLASVRAFPARLKSAPLPALHALVCNAGVQQVARPTRTADGFETTFAVNHLGHFLLAHLLLDALAPGGQVIFVASNTHDPRQHTGMPAPRWAGARQLASDDEPGGAAGRRRYTTSKLCNVLCAYELARRLSAAKDPRLASLRANAFDPGLMPGTGLARDWGPLARAAFKYVMPALCVMVPNTNTAERSGRRLAALVDDPAPSGRYFSRGRDASSSAESHDAAKARELWEGSAELVGLAPGESPLAR